MGTDAVMLVQHAGLNPMGHGDPPRAGCPIGNLRCTLADLVEQAGLSVVILLYFLAATSHLKVGPLTDRFLCALLPCSSCWPVKC